MNTKDLVKNIVKTLDAKQAKDIKVIKVTDITILADYFVIATGTNNTHVKTLAEETEFILSRQGVEPHHIEGKSSSWILLDYSAAVVHVFHGEARGFYDLERLWQDGEEVDLAEFIDEEEES